MTAPTRREVLVAAGSAAVTTSRAFAQGPQDVIIALSSLSFGTAGARMAKDVGLFEKHGLNASFVLIDTANTATSALISGALKVVLSGSGELVVARARGQDVVAIANTFAGFSSSLVLSKVVVERLGLSAEAPVEQRLKALDGLVIGATSPTSTASVSFKIAAKAAGATIRFSYMGQPAMSAALESGALQGYSAAAPFWALPVMKGTGVLWISGPKAELPPDSMPASSGTMQVMRGFAEANPVLVGKLAAVFDDFAKFVDEQPKECRDQLSKLYPEIDAPTLDLLFRSEAVGWKARRLTAADMAKEISFVKLGGASVPNLDQLSPADMIYP